MNKEHQYCSVFLECQLAFHWVNQEDEYQIDSYLISDYSTSLKKVKVYENIQRLLTSFMS